MINFTFRRLVLLLLLPLLTAAGCTSGGNNAGSMFGLKPQPKQALVTDDRSPAAIQQSMMDFADTYANTVGDAYGEILQNKTVTPEARRAALSICLANARGAFINATDNNPISGLVNMVVLVNLQRRASDENWFQVVFGSYTEKTRTVMANQDRMVWDLAARYLTADQLQELHTALDGWWKEHSNMKFITLVRLEDFQQAKAVSEGKLQVPNSVFSLLFIDPFASLDPAIREVQETRLAAARMFYYVQRMPDLIRLEAESLYMDVLSAPQITSIVDSTSTFTANTTSFTQSCKEFSATIAKLPGDLTVEREKTVAQLNEIVATQREAAIKQLADATTKEREGAIVQLAAAVDKERKAAVDQIAEATAKEREAALKQAADTINKSQKETLANLNTVGDQLIDRLTRQLIIAISIAAVISAILVGLIMLGYRKLAARIARPA